MIKLNYKRFKPLNYKVEQRSIKSLNQNQQSLVNGLINGFFICFCLFILLTALFFIITTFTSTSPSLPLESLLNRINPQKEIIKLPESWSSASTYDDLIDLCEWPILSITPQQPTTVNLLIQDEPIHADLTKDFNRYNLSKSKVDSATTMAAFIIKAYYTIPFQSGSSNNDLVVNLCHYARDGFGNEALITHASYQLTNEKAQSIDWTTITSFQLIGECEQQQVTQ